MLELSPNYVSALFKKEVGMTVSEYIQQSKIDEAKKLISYSKTPISEICSLLNFTDQSYFTKVFKKHTGTTPKQYREKHHLLEK
jgi:YesN/AraC family two-component response regulator